jgi:hypothetical protein
MVLDRSTVAYVKVSHTFDDVHIKLAYHTMYYAKLVLLMLISYYLFILLQSQRPNQEGPPLGAAGYVASHLNLEILWWFHVLVCFPKDSTWLWWWYAIKEGAYYLYVFHVLAYSAGATIGETYIMPPIRGSRMTRFDWRHTGLCFGLRTVLFHVIISARMSVFLAACWGVWLLAR